MNSVVYGCGPSLFARDGESAGHAGQARPAQAAAAQGRAGEVGFIADIFRSRKARWDILFGPGILVLAEESRLKETSRVPVVCCFPRRFILCAACIHLKIESV